MTNSSGIVRKGHMVWELIVTLLTLIAINSIVAVPLLVLFKNLWAPR